MMLPSPFCGGLGMVRTWSFLILFGSLNLIAQKIEVLYRTYLLHPHAICGPIRMQARMLDTSLDRPVVPHQTVGITLNNLKSTPIVIERITLHFGGETPTSGASFEAETRVPVGASQEAIFAQSTTVQNPISYVELNSVKYADGSSWSPSDGAACKIAPEPLARSR
jgi:hypothetical protein